MCKWNTTDILDLPDHVCAWKENRTVCIDQCIVEQVKALWAAGYETLGSCCGHSKEGPSVIMAEGYAQEEITQKIVPTLATDSREWLIMQRRLAGVASSHDPNYQPRLIGSVRQDGATP